MCHPGFGAQPNLPGKLTEVDYKNIDCLICHSPNYKRGVMKEGEKLKFWAAAGVDVLKAAQNVRRPTNEMCLRCHLATGGGPNHKHGVIPTKDSDIHVAKGMNCINCHITRNHKIAGGSDLKVQDLWDVRIDCTNCHKEQVLHKADGTGYLNKHLARIQCQTCHIPAAARDPKLPTIAYRDWTKPVLNQQTGLYGPANKLVSNVKPEYRWWNRWMETPPEPVGSIDDPKSKITPWKRTDYKVIADEETGKAVLIKAGVYAVTGDPAAAAKKGAEEAKQAYSGKWKGVTESMVFSMNHQVAPKAEALKCNACHSPTGVMDFKRLGYSEEQIKDLTKPR
ncbi:MAG: Cytochrome c bacterial [Syntrophorhabdus sp. PtaU1.Bin153]|nr:MAG: Cytochrome c bacterial [Syntrophorhabdus sp. PtaU1.Bin153]